MPNPYGNLRDWQPLAPPVLGEPVVGEASLGYVSCVPVLDAVPQAPPGASLAARRRPLRGRLVSRFAFLIHAH